MLEEIYEDNLIGDPNDLEEIIEQQGDELFDEAEEEQDTEGNANSATADGNDNSNATRVEPKKRTVKNPRPKLDPERLKGPRGITVIEDAFKDFKFYGKGYEKADLNRVMKRLEHWAHRLYPRFQFDDCLDKIEKLGQKKPVQVYVTKIRMGLETVEEPLVLLDDNDDSEINNETPIDAFDELLSQQLSQVGPENQAHVASSVQVPLLPDQSVVLQSMEMTTEQRERMLRNKLIAEERRLARMKERCEIKKTAEVELSTVEVPVQPSAAISLSNNEITTSSYVISEINTNSTEVSVSEKATVSSTGAVCSAHTTYESEETSVFCKVVEFEGTNSVFGPVDNEEDTISKPTALGKVTSSSQLVDAEETYCTSVNTEQADTAVISVNTEVVNTSSGPIIGQETNAVCMLDDSEQTYASSVPVLGEDTAVSSLPFDTKETYATSMPMDSEDPDVTSMPLDTEETYAASMPMDSEDPDVTSMPLDTEEETYATSMPIDGEESDVISMPFDTEETYPISVHTDSEVTDVTSMSVDAEGTDTTSLLLNAKDSDATSMPDDGENTTSSL